LDGNKLRSISKNQLSNPKLKFLDLAGNEIYSIEKGAFDNLEELEFLYLWNNFCIRELFDVKNQGIDFVNQKLATCNTISAEDGLVCEYKLVGLYYTCVLKNVKVRENQNIRVFGHHSLIIRDDEDVSQVIFENSKLAEIPTDIFRKFENLKTLNVDSSNLKKINKIQNCQNLENFSAAQNKILKLEAKTFENCPNLKTINLSRNHIGKVPANLFGDGLKLKQLDLSNNAILSIQPGFLDNLKNLDVLNLKNNLCASGVFNLAGGNSFMIKMKLTPCFVLWRFV
jgi:hypothetical protein